MKIGIISDAHLFHKYAITTKQYKNILSNLDTDIIVDCGDLTDGSILSAPQLDNLFTIFKDIDKPYYYVSGNHDSFEGTTVASILNLNKNIHIIKDVTVLDNMLFIPYTNNIKQLYSNLDKIVKEPLDVAFSHLNITNLFYADIPFNNSKNLHKYADTWFNGHIHNPEIKEDIYGTIYNVGSCSALTFGDTHIPCYTIYDTDTKNTTQYTIEGTHIFKIYNTNNVFDVKESIQELTKKFILHCRFNLQNTKNSLDLKRDICNNLKNIDNIFISFNSVSNIIKNNTINSDIRIKTENKESLLEQLFKYFEQDTKTIIDENMRKEVYNIDKI